MNQRRWLDQSQPQTLQIAVLLLYINAFFLLLGSLGFGGGLALLLAGGMGAGGYGIANEKRWGYGLAVGTASVNLLLPIAVVGIGGLFSSTSLLIRVMFDAALLALLLHPHSREYQRIWFH